MKKCTSFIYFQITLQLEVYVPEDSWKQSIICHRVTRLQNTYTDCAWLKEERSCKIKKCTAWSISAFFSPFYIVLWYISKSCGNAMLKYLTFILATQFRCKNKLFGVRTVLPGERTSHECQKVHSLWIYWGWIHESGEEGVGKPKIPLFFIPQLPHQF